MEEQISKSEIIDLIHTKQWKKLKRILIKSPIWDIAELLHDAKDKEMVIMMRLLPRALAAEVFAELETIDQQALLEQMETEEVKTLILEMSADDRTELFEELPTEVTHRLLSLLPASKRKQTLELLGYPKDSVGRLMIPDYIAVRPEFTIKQVLEQIKNYGEDSQVLDEVYVINNEKVLVDVLPLRKFILSSPEETVESIMDRQFIAITSFEDQEAAVLKMQRYNLVALPILDTQGVLLGIVTIDDALDVMEEEATEDFEKKSALLPLKRNYLDIPSWYLFQKRVIWLFFLLLAGFFSSSVITHYQDSIQSLVALSFFIPVLIGSGGNTAMQSATLIIRAISLGELTPGKWFTVIKKELITGILIGLTLGIVIFLRGYFSKQGGDIGYILGLSMILIIIWSNLLGGLLPMLLTKIKLDPAIISAPLLATLIDGTSLIIYFTIAGLILRA